MDWKYLEAGFHVLEIEKSQAFCFSQPVIHDGCSLHFLVRWTSASFLTPLMTKVTYRVAGRKGLVAGLSVNSST